ncbi:acyltransferase [Bergeyella zoohelcum]|uniref:acyltransferase n=1 Tax=Bergeyella zoohelcum TaxID=1015 RepID=UPI003736C078
MLFLSKLLYYLLKRPSLKKIQAFGKSPRIGDFCNFTFHHTAKVTIGEKLELRNHCSIRVEKDATLSIGNNVFMNNGCSVNCLEKIEIGENTLFGEGVKLYDHNHEYSSEKVERQKFKKAPIKIGKNCWLGSNVVVLKGVTIGNNSIIGANVTVYKDIPAHSVVVNKSESVIKSVFEFRRI